VKENSAHKNRDCFFVRDTGGMNSCLHAHVVKRVCYGSFSNAPPLLLDESSDLKGDLMKSSFTNLSIALLLIVIGVGIAAAGIYIGETDDAPGAALIGILLMIGAVMLAVRTMWRKA
jgi:hypothetical protein